MHVTRHKQTYRVHPGMSQVAARSWNRPDVLHGRALEGASLFVHATKDSKGILRTCRSPRNVGMHAVTEVRQSLASPDPTSVPK